MTAVPSGKIARGAAWMVSARIADRLVGIVSTVVLARLLTPADFGLVAMAMSVIGLIELASEFGFEVSLVRTASPTRAHYDTVWTLNVLFGVGCSVLVALVAFPAAHYYGDDRLIPIMLVLAGAWAVGSFLNVGIVDFQRTLDFAKEFRFLITRRLIGFVVTIGLALWTRSYWALIAGSVTTRVTGLVLSYLWHSYRPRLGLGASRQVFSFSIWIFVEKVATFGNVRAADFVLGRVHGPAELGIYRLGEEIGHLPGTELIAPLNRALLPGVSQANQGGSVTRDYVLAPTGIVALLLLPACLGISAISDPLVRVMLGTKWLATAPVLQIMALNSLFVGLWSIQHTTLFAVGRPRLPGLISVARLLVFAPCLFLLVEPFAARGVAVAALTSSAFALVLGLLVGLPVLGVRLAAYLGALWRPVLAAAVMWSAVTWLLSALDGVHGTTLDFLRLLASVIGGCVVYVSVLSILYVLSGRPAGAEKLLLDRLLPVVRNVIRWPR